MSRIIEQPPENGVRSDGLYAGGWWHTLEGDERIVCDLCPRECHLKPGDRGFCFVRQNVDGEMMLTTYGRSTGFCIDPIEKKPLNHFLPGTSVLSFGTAGCNLTCKFCQNWDMSKSREMDTLADAASPETLARAAVDLGCRSIAYTYNDPVIFLEYAIDVAKACREQGIRSVAVSAGYVTPEAGREFFAHMDAANIDLKGFTEDFYRTLCSAHLQPVLDTLMYLRHETDVWIEITTLLIPGHNDSEAEIAAECRWMFENLGPDVPLHFSAFHPDWRMRDVMRTPHKILGRARRIALDAGLRYVYVGNVHDHAESSTYCHACGEMLIGRDWYVLDHWALTADGRCGNCGTAMAGVIEGSPGDWGAKRQPVRLANFEPGARRHNQPIRGAAR